MAIDECVATSIARHLVTSMGITPLRRVSVKLINGPLRDAVFGAVTSDFWLVTFKRDTTLIAGIDDLTEDECDILSAVADEADQISVVVEMDGSAEVV